MIKTIDIEGKKVKVDSSSWWLIIYREQFGHDILADVMPVLEVLLQAAAEGEEKDGELSLGSIDWSNPALFTIEIAMIPQVLWAMAYNADEKVGDPQEFMKSLSTFPMDKIGLDLLAIIAQSFMTRKNWKRLQETFPDLKTEKKTTGSQQRQS